ncbi:hypothetical protein M569_07435 [Genlisea aurea]|uniref:Metallo-beta-lactamase domain-containing protein n=1 Tax=Genlisea aurea TaxID=192259 RepID=S8CJL4_9LAMI|nr:hypothetical protein M569_07435 [Genlisea aurea]
MRDLAVGLGLTNCFGFGLISTPCLAASFNSLSSFMEFTCLSHGNGLYFPPCHILDICGVRVLLDCPIDLSSLTIFSPVTINPNRNVDNENRGIVGKTLDANSFICGEPLYRTVKNLELFNASFIDVVLISNPNGMFGLPFLMRASDFNAKVYATKAAARIGQLLMEDLVHMHREFKHVYGHGGSSAPKWLKWDELDLLPEELKQIVLGQDGTKFGRWAPLYSAADVKACMLKVECLNLAEEVCYDGTLIIKPYSSGLEIGSCNWTISSSKGSFAWLSNASFSSASPMSFDYAISGAADVILLSDFSCLTSNDESFNADISSVSRDGTKSEENASFQGGQGYADEIEKLDFICSCSVDALKDGGSVLIPIGRLWVILQLLDQLSLHLESRDVKVHPDDMQKCYYNAVYIESS